MTFPEAVSRMFSEFVAVLSNSGYALFKIEAHVVCAVIIIILLYRQQSSSDHTEARVVWGRLLFVQILFCLSGIFRVLVDISIIPSSPSAQFIASSLNFITFGAVCWYVFMYNEFYQRSDLLNSLRNKILVSLPFAFNVIMILLSPFTGWFIKIGADTITDGPLMTFMYIIQVSYTIAAVAFAVIRRRKMTRYERDVAPLMAIYPSFFMICGPLQSLNWKVPFLCYIIVIADIFVYISYADSLVSIDPLTKIPNKNGLMRELSERLRRENPELLHVFAADVEDLSAINASYDRSEGDRVLVIIAEALKKFRDEEHECFVAHYYGDEFILTADIQDDEERELFIEHIRNYISNASISSGLKHYIHVNIGWARYEQFSKTETISGLIDEAERVLNETKEQRRFQNMWKL
ncbi:MAG: diguanylate cyclase [Synergistaceae bacterium]|nr:diguanylate cyclase [Synergistaceae bacterium]